jgi:hypothetical protein
MGFSLKGLLKTGLKIAAVVAVGVIAVKTGGAALPLLKGLGAKLGASKLGASVLAKLPALQTVASNFAAKFMSSPLALQSKSVLGSFSGILGQSGSSKTLANILESVGPQLRGILGGERVLQQMMNVAAQTHARNIMAAFRV